MSVRRRIVVRLAVLMVGVGVLSIVITEGRNAAEQKPQQTFPFTDFELTLESLPEGGQAMTEHDVVVDGVRVHYAEGGEGAPIILCHGWAMNHRHWYRNMEALTAVGHVYAIDWPGYGKSQKEFDDVTAAMDPARQADVLLGFMNALGLDDVTLVGHSMGGHWTSTFLLEHQDRVARYIAVDSAAIMRHPPAYRERVIELAAAPAFELRANAGQNELMQEAQERFWSYHVDPSVITPEFVDQVSNFSSWNDPDSVPILVESLRGLGNSPLRDELHCITTPTLVIWGGRDVIILPQYARELAAAMPNAQLLMLPKSAHNPMLDNSEIFNRAVAQFILSN